MSTTVIAQARPVAISFTQSAPALTSLFFGAVLIFLVGFAPMAEIHNAAHDTRHATAFPCH